MPYYNNGDGRNGHNNYHNNNSSSSNDRRVSHTNGGGGGGGESNNYFSMAGNRRRHFYYPPLWHFHRLLAERENSNSLFDNGNQNHVVQIDAVDWMITENGTNHKTSNYELVSERKALVVRRGGKIQVGLRCKNRAFDLNRDRLKVIFEFGEYPIIGKGTKGVFELVKDRNKIPDDDEWWAAYVGKQHQRIDIDINVPVSAPVGLWNVTFETWYENRIWEAKEFQSEKPVYILFNAFNREDEVYMDSQVARNEYLFNDVGKLYGGSHNNIQGRPWIFGQFHESILPAVCHLLDKIALFLRDSERGNVVKVARAISAVVNSVDDNGVLAGRWDGNYEDGTQPYAWTGSVKILEEYMKTGKPVKYGQCWVFSGIVTTVCRALGIPCRSVTNYLSAHDTDNSLSVDKYLDEDGEEITSASEASAHGSSSIASVSDSIWNFHLWNEVWAKRPDLSDKEGIFDGWQVVDSTPQETSDSLYRCGPASVEAVRRGQVGMGYDVAFVFSEVNADVFVFAPDPNSIWGYRLADSNVTHVGKKVITKAIENRSALDHMDNDDDYEDITSNYKYAEGSASERLTMMSAAKSVGGNAMRRRRVEKADGDSARGDVDFVMADLEQEEYGKPYSVTLGVHNKSGNVRSVEVLMSTSSVYYTGAKAHMIMSGRGEFVLRGHERETLSMKVNPEVYMPKTVEHCAFVNKFLVTVKETNQIWSGNDDFVLVKPKLSVRVSSDPVRAHRFCDVTIRFENPLEDELTGCVFQLEAPGMIENVKLKHRNISPGEVVELRYSARPLKAGNSTIVAAFNCRELFNITGTKKVTIIS